MLLVEVKKTSNAFGKKIMFDPMKIYFKFIINQNQDYEAKSSETTESTLANDLIQRY